MVKNDSCWTIIKKVLEKEKEEKSTISSPMWLFFYFSYLIFFKHMFLSKGSNETCYAIREDTVCVISPFSQTDNVRYNKYGA